MRWSASAVRLPAASLALSAVLSGCALIDGLRGDKSNGTDGGSGPGPGNSGDFCLTVQDPALPGANGSGGCDVMAGKLVLIGETRTVPLRSFMTMTQADAAPIALQISRMGSSSAQAALRDASIERNGGTVLTLTGATGPETASFSIIGTSNGGTFNLLLTLTTQDPMVFGGQGGDDIVISPSGRTALAIDCFANGGGGAGGGPPPVHRLSKIDPALLKATQTLLDWTEPRSAADHRPCTNALAIEPGEMTALVGVDGLRRIDLASGALSSVGASFEGLPNRIIVDSTGVTVLATPMQPPDAGVGPSKTLEIQRADPALNGPVSTVLSAFDGVDLAPEPGSSDMAGLAILTDWMIGMTSGLARESWAGGSLSRTPLVVDVGDRGPGVRVILEPDAQRYLTSSLLEIDVATRATRALVSKVSGAGGGIAVALDHGDPITEVLLADPMSGHAGAVLERLSRSATVTPIAGFTPYVGGFAVKAGTAYVARDGALVVVDLASGRTSTLTLSMRGRPAHLIVDGKDGSLLAIGFGETAAFSRIDPMTGTVSVITQLTQPSDLAQQSSDLDHVLVVDNLEGKLLRVGTQDGSITELTTSFGGATGSMVGLTGIAIAPDGTKALLTAAAGLFEVDLGSGAARLIYPGTPGVYRIAVASDGSFAVLQDGGLVMLDLAKRTRTRIATAGGVGDLLLESGDQSLLVITSAPDGSSNGLERLRFR
jgi:hypothetical protein